MLKHLKITAISFILATACTTAASAQTDARPAISSYYGYDGGPFAAGANGYPGFGRSAGCNSGLNDAVNAARSPSMRYPIPDRCINQ
jgi:hypothetical protein